jgi:hypothetical protein
VSSQYGTEGGGGGGESLVCRGAGHVTRALARGAGRRGRAARRLRPRRHARAGEWLYKRPPRPAVVSPSAPKAATSSAAPRSDGRLHRGSPDAPPRARRPPPARRRAARRARRARAAAARAHAPGQKGRAARRRCGERRHLWRAADLLGGPATARRGTRRAARLGRAGARGAQRAARAAGRRWRRACAPAHRGYRGGPALVGGVRPPPTPSHGPVASVWGGWGSLSAQTSFSERNLKDVTALRG